MWKFRIGKFTETEDRYFPGAGEIWEWDRVYKYRIYFESDKNIQELDMMLVAQLYDCTKIYIL